MQQIHQVSCRAQHRTAVFAGVVVHGAEQAVQRGVGQHSGTVGRTAGQAEDRGVGPDAELWRGPGHQVAGRDVLHRVRDLPGSGMDGAGVGRCEITGPGGDESLLVLSRDPDRGIHSLIEQHPHRVVVRTQLVDPLHPLDLLGGSRIGRSGDVRVAGEVTLDRFHAQLEPPEVVGEEAVHGGPDLRGGGRQQLVVLDLGSQHRGRVTQPDLRGHHVGVVCLPLRHGAARNAFRHRVVQQRLPAIGLVVPAPGQVQRLGDRPATVGVLLLDRVQGGDQRRVVEGQCRELPVEPEPVGSRRVEGGADT